MHPVLWIPPSQYPPHDQPLDNMQNTPNTADLSCGQKMIGKYSYTITRNDLKMEQQAFEVGKGVSTCVDHIYICVCVCILYVYIYM